MAMSMRASAADALYSGLSTDSATDSRFLGSMMLVTSVSKAAKPRLM